MCSQENAEKVFKMAAWRIAFDVDFPENALLEAFRAYPVEGHTVARSSPIYLLSRNCRDFDAQDRRTYDDSSCVGVMAAYKPQGFRALLSEFTRYVPRRYRSKLSAELLFALYDQEQRDWVAEWARQPLTFAPWTLSELESQAQAVPSDLPWTDSGEICTDSGGAAGQQPTPEVLHPPCRLRDGTLSKQGFVAAVVCQGANDCIDRVCGSLPRGDRQ